MYVFDTRADVDVLRVIAAANGDDSVTIRHLVRHIQISFRRGEGRSAEFAAQYRARLEQANSAARAVNPGGQGGLVGNATLSFLPATRRRIERLQAMGAQMPKLANGIAGAWKAWLLVSPVALLLAALVGMLLYLGAMLVMMTSMVFVAMPVGLVHLFLRWVAS